MIAEAAIVQTYRWIDQWGRLVWNSSLSSGHLQRSTPAHDREGEWKQGAWARQQLMANEVTVRKGADWIREIQQQHGNLAELTPWDRQTV